MLFNGDVWGGRQAHRLGLVDGVGFIEDIIREKFGEGVELKKYRKPRPWLARLLNPDDDDGDGPTESRLARRARSVFATWSGGGSSDHAAMEEAAQGRILARAGIELLDELEARLQYSKYGLYR